jgi:antitoxin (DNA-binding transcriptional repressor) of toxin-antitoxin stability system
MSDMRRLNIRELHRRTGAVVEQVARGDSVVIEKRGVPLAEMRPLRPAGRGFPPGHWEFLKRFPKFKDDSGQLISRDRERGCCTTSILPMSPSVT